MLSPEAQHGAAAGFTLAELLLVAVLLGGMAQVSLRQAQLSLAQERVESASRRIALGLEQARLAASRSGRPCGLSLGQEGWRPPLEGPLPACAGFSPIDAIGGEGIDRAEVQLEHNLPALVRFTSNGLVLDGGTVRIAASGTPLVRCLVMALPLGVVRLGRWQQESCQADAAL